MPAQICHAIFAEEAMQEVLTKTTGQYYNRILARWGNLFRFGAQGPDFFYHNRRTKPSGLKFGVLLHREGYGRFLVILLKESMKIGTPVPDPIAAFVLGFTTHAFLDRETHPFIDYFSGWVDSRREESSKYFRCHAFFERILDVLLLKERRKMEICKLDFHSLIDLDGDFPPPLKSIIGNALSKSYTCIPAAGEANLRIDNALKDASFFYRHTNYGDEEQRRKALELDMRGPFMRRLALFHPERLPEWIDYLNSSGNRWVHPCYHDRESCDSFIQLYERAFRKVITPLHLILQILRGDHELDAGRLEEAIGNQSLNTVIDPEKPCRYASPLPLAEILDTIYADVCGLPS